MRSCSYWIRRFSRRMGTGTKVPAYLTSGLVCWAGVKMNSLLECAISFQWGHYCTSTQIGAFYLCCWSWPTDEMSRSNSSWLRRLGRCQNTSSVACTVRQAYIAQVAQVRIFHLSLRLNGSHQRLAGISRRVTVLAALMLESEYS